MNSPIRLILKWAGPDRKYLIAAVVFAFVSGLMAMVPYYGVYEIMKAAYEGTCTWEVITSNALVVAVGVCIQYACFGCAGALSHKGAYNTLFRVRCRVVDHLAHDVECAVATCDRVLHLRDGRVAQDVPLRDAEELLAAMR